MRLVTAALIAGVLASAAYAERGVERWSALSHTATGITGDISLSPARLVVAGRTLPLAVAADVKGFQTDQGPQDVRILRVTRPANPLLLNGNRFCTAPVRWIVVYRQDKGKTLGMAVFATATQPAQEDVPGLCGTFSYMR